MEGLGNKAIMARNIQRLMDKAGKTRLQVCEDLGFKYTTFTDWVNGNTYPRIDKIEMMANYFGVSKADLVEDVTDGEQRQARLEELAKEIADLTASMERMMEAQYRSNSQIRVLIGSTVETPKDRLGLAKDADRLIQEVDEFLNTKLSLLPQKEQKEIMAKISALSRAGLDAMVDEAIKQRENMKHD